MRHIIYLFAVIIFNHTLVFAEELCEFEEDSSYVSVPWNGRCAWIVRERFNETPGYIDRDYGNVIIQQLYNLLISDPNVLSVLCTGTCENCNFCGRERKCNTFVASNGLNCKCIH